MPVLAAGAPLLPDPSGEFPPHVRAVAQAAFDLENGVFREVVTSVGRIGAPPGAAHAIIRLLAEGLPRPCPGPRYVVAPPPAGGAGRARHVLVSAPPDDLPRRDATLVVAPKEDTRAEDDYGEGAVRVQSVVAWRRVRDSAEFQDAKVVVFASSFAWRYRAELLADPLVGGVRWSRLVVLGWDAILADVPALEAEFTWLLGRLPIEPAYKARRDTTGLLVATLPAAVCGVGGDFVPRIEISVADSLLRQGATRPVEFVCPARGMNWSEVRGRCRQAWRSPVAGADVLRDLVADIDAGHVAASEGRRAALGAVAEAGICACPICMEELPPDRCVALGCTHVFCAGCAVRVFRAAEEDTGCPVCRERVTRVLIPGDDGPPFVARDTNAVVREAIAAHSGSVVYCATDRDGGEGVPCEVRHLGGGTLGGRLRTVSAAIFDAQKSSAEDLCRFLRMVRRVYAPASAPTLTVYALGSSSVRR